MFFINKINLADTEVYWFIEIWDIFLRYFSYTYYITFFLCKTI